MRNSPLGILVPALLLLLTAAMAAQAAPPRNRKQAAKPRMVNIKVNIQEVVDSALLMADDYATALAQKPEFALTRLNVLKKYYTSLHSDAARDSVRSRIFDFYVNYVETDKTGQADAFKQSFLAIAPRHRRASRPPLRQRTHCRTRKLRHNKSQVRAVAP